MVFKKVFRRAEAFPKKPPEPASADFRTRATEAVHGLGGMFLRRFPDKAENFQPVLHGIDFSEGNSGLRHSERSRIHSEKNDAFASVPVAAQKKLVHFACVI